MKNEKSPSEVLKKMAFADTAMSDPQRKAQMLISLNKGVKSAKEKINSLKQELLPVVQKQPIQIGDDVIIYVAGSKGTVMNKARLKQVLMEELHMTEMAAEAFIIKISTEKLMHPYAKVVSRSALDRVAQSLKNSRTNQNPAQIAAA